MTMREFIRKNRKALDESIRNVLQQPECKLNDDERENWVLNDESLYNWAKREAVPV